MLVEVIVDRLGFQDAPCREIDCVPQKELLKYWLLPILTLSPTTFGGHLLMLALHSCCFKIADVWSPVLLTSHSAVYVSCSYQTQFHFALWDHPLSHPNLFPCLFFSFDLSHTLSVPTWHCLLYSVKSCPSWTDFSICTRVLHSITFICFCVLSQLDVFEGKVCESWDITGHKILLR